jgi:membrane-associated phospholipid phosphatase
MALAVIIPIFFRYIQARQGMQLNDLLLQWIPPLNLSIFIFAVIYSVAVFSIYYISHLPIRILRLMLSYALLLILRITTLTFISLEPHPMLVPLKDPLVDRFFYSEINVTKDLFFSGHVSTLFLFFLIVHGRKAKRFILIATILVAASLLLQHVHYTIDVIAAPIFAFSAYRLAGIFLPKF